MLYETRILQAAKDRNVEEVQALLIRAPRRLMSSKSFVLRVVRLTQRWQFALSGTPQLLRDASFVRAVMRATQSGAIVPFVDRELLEDKPTMMLACLIDPMMVMWAGEALSHDRELATCVLSQQGGALRYLPLWMRDEAGLVALACQTTPCALEHASQRLQDDDDLLHELLARAPDALQFASPRLRGDRRMVLRAVRADGLALAHARPLLWDDAEIVRAAVEQNGAALLIANDGLRDDEDLVRMAVAYNGVTLRGASLRLRDDPAVVRLAVAQQCHAFDAASDRLKDDPAFVSEVVAANGDALQYASRRLRAQKPLALLAARAARMCFMPVHFGVPPPVAFDEDFITELCISNYNRSMPSFLLARLRSLDARVAVAGGEELETIAEAAGTIAAKTGHEGALRLVERLDAPSGPLRAHREAVWDGLW